MSLVETHSAANQHKSVCESSMNADLICLILWMILVPLVVAVGALGLAMLNIAA